MGEFSVSIEDLACSGVRSGQIEGIGREIDADEWQAVPNKISDPWIPNILASLMIPKMPNAPAETKIGMQVREKS